MTQPKCHELKCWPVFFTQLHAGTKTFEVRVDDRNFRAGDELYLREWRPGGRGYTGRGLKCEVLGITDIQELPTVALHVSGIHPVVIMSIRVLRDGVDNVSDGQ